VLNSREVKEAEEKTLRRGPLRNYTDRLVYKQAYRLTLDIPKLTRALPRQEQNELGRQVQRSSRAVAANIVEGWAKRTSSAKFKRHLILASGGAADTKFWLDLAADEGFAAREACAQWKAEYSKVAMMIHNLWKEWRKLP